MTAYSRNGTGVNSDQCFARRQDSAVRASGAGAVRGRISPCLFSRIAAGAGR